MTTIEIRELINAGCANGIHVNAANVWRAIRLGTLTPTAFNPPRFEVGAARAWLDRLWREDNRL